MTMPISLKGLLLYILILRSGVLAAPVEPLIRPTSLKNDSDGHCRYVDIHESEHCDKECELIDPNSSPGFILNTTSAAVIEAPRHEKSVALVRVLNRCVEVGLTGIFNSSACLPKRGPRACMVSQSHRIDILDRPNVSLIDELQCYESIPDRVWNKHGDCRTNEICVNSIGQNYGNSLARCVNHETFVRSASLGLQDRGKDQQTRAQHKERESPTIVSEGEVMDVSDLEVHSRSSLKSEKRTLTRPINQCTESPNQLHFLSSHCTQDVWPRSYIAICHQIPQLRRVSPGHSMLYVESGECLQHEICLQLRSYPYPYPQAACVSEEKYARIAKLALDAEKQRSDTTPLHQLREQTNQKRGIMSLSQQESSSLAMLGLQSGEKKKHDNQVYIP